MAHEVAALVEVAGEAADRMIVTPAQSLHRAIAGRVFVAVSPGGALTRRVHDGIVTTTYGAVRGSLRLSAKTTAAALRLAGGEADVRPLSRSRRGRHAVSAINALIGDLLDADRSDLAIEMSVRRSGRDLPVTRSALRGAFPAATAGVAVFLHGLAENEEWWLRGARRRRGTQSGSFGRRLRSDLGLTPVYVRYNTGLHVSQNGRRLAELLGQLVAAWPVEVADLVLVGHSMGGLVARSACDAAHTTRPPQRWLRHLRHIVTLGTPHTGAPLEKAVHAAAWTLRRLPESAPLAAILDARSAGIRDLRHGYVRGDEWQLEDPTRLLDDRRLTTPPLDGCAHTFITATVTRDPRHPLGWIAGDLLVRADSAGGRHRTRPVLVPPESVVHVGRLTHFDLLDHPDVYAPMRDALRHSLAGGGSGPNRPAC